MPLATATRFNQLDNNSSGIGGGRTGHRVGCSGSRSPIYSIGIDDRSDAAETLDCAAAMGVFNPAAWRPPMTAAEMAACSRYDRAPPRRYVRCPLRPPVPLPVLA